MNLAADIRAIADMVKTDGGDERVAVDLRGAADFVEGLRPELARARLRSMYIASMKRFDLIKGAEEHISLAVAAFEAVHGKVIT